MPIWPFKKRRRSVANKDATSEPLIDEKPRPTSIVSEKPTAPIPIPRHSSKRDRATSIGSNEEISVLNDKENVPPSHERNISSRDLTALPMSYKLQQSPHLRPIDAERPHIPYNFRNAAESQTSVQRESSTASPRPNVLRKKRSSYDSGAPRRKQSTRTRKEEQIREEEIRAMSSSSPLSKRRGDGPLRRDSKKVRSGLKESTVSLPPPDESEYDPSIGITEQRGWELGGFSMFSPRPAVRLSGTPQYVASASIRSNSPVPTEPVRKLKEKERAPGSRDKRMRDTIGDRADDLGASDIRMLLERDAKRRSKRDQEQHERLDRKIRSRAGRNRGDSDKRREADEVRRIEEARQRAEEQLRAHENVPPPTDTHPAFRDQQEDGVGLGIERDAAVAGAATGGAVAVGGAVVVSETLDQPSPVSPLDETEDPFTDAAEEQSPRASHDQMPGTFTPLGSPSEEPVLETAKAVRMSQASTPPLSPIHSTRAIPTMTETAEPRETSETPAPVPIVAPRRASQPNPERRTGALSSLFKRGGSRKASAAKPPSEMSFSNTSRESMRNQALPAHLVGIQPQTVVVRRASGTPVRTQSRFREDLPELPVSPPDSRVGSPAAVTAYQGRAAGSALVDVPRERGPATAGSEAPTAPRFDTPISPSLRHGASLASVDSEGAWLASGNTKRQSKSTLGQRRPDFTASYEELGTDTDGQHFTRAAEIPGTSAGAAQVASGTIVAGGSKTLQAQGFFDARDGRESPIEETEADIPAVHGSVQRKPTLVKRDARLRSREGLLDEFAVVEPEPTSAADTRGSFEFDSDAEASEPELQRASSVLVHKQRLSTGSAQILDVAPRRNSGADLLDDASQPSTPSKL